MSEDLAYDHLLFSQRLIAKKILSISKAESGGGCKAFYTPEEWKDRGESYGLESHLIVVHDGGDLAPWFNLDYMQYDLYDRMFKGLEEIGFWPEACTCWYTAIYPRVNEEERMKELVRE